MLYFLWCYCSDCFFFFFKQKTAYEMRISDWSSDVCSSDLSRARHALRWRNLDRRNHRPRIRPLLGDSDDHQQARQSAVWSMGVKLLADADRLDRRSGPCIRHGRTVAHSRHEGAVGLVLLACDPRINRLLRLVVRSVEHVG